MERPKEICRRSYLCSGIVSSKPLDIAASPWAGFYLWRLECVDGRILLQEEDNRPVADLAIERGPIKQLFLEAQRVDLQSFAIPIPAQALPVYRRDTIGAAMGEIDGARRQVKVTRMDKLATLFVIGWRAKHLQYTLEIDAERRIVQSKFERVT